MTYRLLPDGNGKRGDKEVDVQRYLLGLVLSTWVLSSLTACQPQPNTLTFHADDGDKRRYQVYSDFTVNADSGDEQHFRQTLLLEYQVQADDDYQIQVRPRYMALNSNGRQFSSTDGDQGADRYARDFVEQGLTLTVDADSGAVSDLQFHADLPSDKPTPEKLLALFRDNLIATPTVGQGIKLERGASQPFHISDQLPELTLTVQQVFEHEVVFTASGEHEQQQLFAIIVSDRDSGWLKRGSLVSKRVREQQQIRTVMSIFQADSGYAMNLDSLARAENIPLYDSLSVEKVLQSDSADAEHMLPSASGRLEKLDTTLLLSYSHQAPFSHHNGRIELDNIELFDKNGAPLPLAIQPLESMTVPDYGNEYRNDGSNNAITLTELLPLGWHDKALMPLYAFSDDGESPSGYATATVNWYPSHSEVKTLTLGDDVTDFNIGRARIEAKPNSDDGGYDVLVQSSREHQLILVSDGISGKFNYRRLDTAPSWISDAEARLMAMLVNDWFPMDYHIRLDDPKQQQLKIAIVSSAEQAADSREVKFEVKRD
ncbi:hypothetical protein [Idiomarina xiamenensis]|uniref:Uncharacterized protein n=1 Tax=Idiomarina xiamenensis 10-D-4 TaxID=740709 RepID=K2K9F9_9GAMM|nr:hypothetical protein [Idiomarina xiamenensis]EKE84423.1 hypothetical protein A10D4_05127 [Idiomarina xiamenensis 10-D-4]